MSAKNHRTSQSQLIISRKKSRAALTKYQLEKIEMNKMAALKRREAKRNCEDSGRDVEENDARIKLNIPEAVDKAGSIEDTVEKKLFEKIPYDKVDASEFAMETQNKKRHKNTDPETISAAVSRQALANTCMEESKKRKAMGDMANEQLRLDSSVRVQSSSKRANCTGVAFGALVNKACKRVS